MYTKSNDKFTILFENGSGIIFNHIIAGVKYISICVKGRKVFNGRDTLSIDQTILQVVNNFCASYSIMIIGAFVNNMLDVNVLYKFLIVFLSIGLAMVCFDALNKMRQIFIAAYLLNDLKNMQDE